MRPQLRRILLPAALVALLVAGAGAGEALVCRGFDADSAARAISSATGRLTTITGDMATTRVWFRLAGADPSAARQALAHALDAWWSDSGRIARGDLLPDGEAGVRTFPPLPITPPHAERSLRGLLRPWLGGSGGLAIDAATGTWTITAPPSGRDRLEAILAAIADPAARAPHLMPERRTDTVALPRAPAGGDLGAWAFDLASLAGVAIALHPTLDAQAAPPPGAARTLDGALALLRQHGVTASLHHGCICLGGADLDRRQPAERAVVAILPVGHLATSTVQVDRLAEQLATRTTPSAWRQPGWAIVALPWRLSLLVVAEPTAIHAVMAELETIDQAGLEAWLR